MCLWRAISRFHGKQGMHGHMRVPHLSPRSPTDPPRRVTTPCSPSPPSELQHSAHPLLPQSYNTLLTLSHLTDLSDGIVLMSNEALHRLANKLYNIPRPSFAVSDSGWQAVRGSKRFGAVSSTWLLCPLAANPSPPSPVRAQFPCASSCPPSFTLTNPAPAPPHTQDMNSIAARALANMLLPSSHRPAAPLRPDFPHDGRRQGTPSPPPLHPSSTTARLQHSRLGSGTRQRQSPPPPHSAGPSPQGVGLPPAPASPLRLLSDVVSHLCCHPHYRLLTLRSIPQVSHI